jgi:bifunctional ADP-heptose synthase (sugar kinase/adenylyltransferase)
MHPKTKEELDTISAYGGEIIFTPGDIVYSSSAILSSEPPNLAVDKLLVLMESEGVTFDRLRRTLQQSEGIAVHVVGDTIVDSLTYTTMVGGMTKTPTPSLRLDRRADFIGGAAIVAAHLRAAGAHVVLSTVLGDDPFRDFVLHELHKMKVDCKAIIDGTRPTTNKNAIVCGDYRMLKIDTLDNRSISEPIMRQLVDQVGATPVRAVAYSDFRHGIFNRLTIPGLIEAMPSGAFRVADSQVASRWGNILEFKNFDLITPNEREARFALADQDSGIRPLASRLHREAACGTLMLKLGDRGILTSRSASGDVRSFFVVDSFAEKVIDAVGAGDALLAYATLAMVTDGSPVVASILGSMAAGAECERDGNVPIYPEDVLAKINKVERQARYT